jgi:hypothetical protein
VRRGRVPIGQYKLLGPEAYQDEDAAARRPAPQTEMLTPKGEHSFPCSTRVMFDGRISLDGIDAAKTL